jgi:GH15 family glucan-1,4-alpha-glucosidase
VRIGNDAANQLQLDIYGELIDSVYLHDLYGSPIDHDAWSDLCRVIDWIAGHWDQADEGSGSCAAEARTSPTRA